MAGPAWLDRRPRDRLCLSAFFRFRYVNVFLFVFNRDRPCSISTGQTAQRLPCPTSRRPVLVASSNRPCYNREYALPGRAWLAALAFMPGFVSLGGLPAAQFKDGNYATLPFPAAGRLLDRVAQWSKWSERSKRFARWNGPSRKRAAQPKRNGPAWRVLKTSKRDPSTNSKRPSAAGRPSWALRSSTTNMPRRVPTACN